MNEAKTDAIKLIAAVVLTFTSVVFAQDECNKNPSVVLIPLTKTAESGTTVPYRIVIKNIDALTCGVSKFVVTYYIPIGWTAQLARQEISIAPGTTSSTTLRITPPRETENATYRLSILVINKNMIGKPITPQTTAEFDRNI